jgi:hypothetical protein
MLDPEGAGERRKTLTMLGVLVALTPVMVASVAVLQ